MVSRVLNPERPGTVRVGKEAEERVRHAMDRLGYVPNALARNLATGVSHLLGVFTYEPIFPTAMRDFYFPFLVGIEQAAEQRGFDLLLFTSASFEGRARSAYRDGVNRLQLADGAVILGRYPNRNELARLTEEGFPVVYVGRREFPGQPGSYVAADYAGGTADITTFLVELGHRGITYVGGPDIDESSLDRESGYRSTLAAIGMERSVRVERLPCSDLDAAWLRRLVDEGATALVVEDDRLARRLIGAAASLDIEIPDALSFAVLGDSIEPMPDDPTWTTFLIPREAMGQRSLELLVELVASADQRARHHVLGCTFVPGTTTARHHQ